MNDFVPTARRARGKGPRTKKAKARRLAKEVTLREKKPTARQQRRLQRQAEGLVAL